jgi:hypothetical protein
MLQFSQEYALVHANQIRQRRKQLFEELPRLFSDRRAKREKDDEALREELYRQIGQLKVELDWLKKISIAPLRRKGSSYQLKWVNFLTTNKGL